MESWRQQIDYIVDATYRNLYATDDESRPSRQSSFQSHGFLENTSLRPSTDTTRRTAWLEADIENVEPEVKAQDDHHINHDDSVIKSQIAFEIESRTMHLARQAEQVQNELSKSRRERGEIIAESAAASVKV